jgi:hypothetical protein
MSAHAAIVLMMSGALAAGYLVASLFFLKFWRETRDRLFAWFAVAFVMLALQRVALAWYLVRQADTLANYVLRLAAFVIILIAIFDKNRPAQRDA